MLTLLLNNNEQIESEKLVKKMPRLYNVEDKN